MRLLAGTGAKPFFGIRSAALSPARLDTRGKEHQANPRPIARWQQDVCRPRTALVHPDGRHVLMAGFAGYGRVGGGIGIHDLETGEDTLLTASENLLPGHSCITLRALPDGSLVGGTSVAAPGGGHPTATEAEIFVLDWATRKVVHRAVPVAGDGNVVSLATAGPLVYGLSGTSTFFVFDSATREIVHREDWSRYGSVPRHALHNGPDGRLYAILANAILRLDPATYRHELLSWTPVRADAGGALANGLLCFASGTHVWSYAVPGLE